jgi:deazaflavin-dependent oxidoreductase (nitroreductase family)
MATSKKPVADFGFHMMNRVHRAVLKVSGGRVLSNPFGMPSVELTTIGAKSGQRRTTMLTSPLHDENRVVLVASRGGAEEHPQWYRNLVANPDVELTLQGSTRQMRARTASPDEKAKLWPDIVASYKGYAGYQKKTERDIPVIICEPRA